MILAGQPRLCAYDSERDMSANIIYASGMGDARTPRTFIKKAKCFPIFIPGVLASWRLMKNF